MIKKLLAIYDEDDVIPFAMAAKELLESCTHVDSENSLNS